MQLRFLVLLIFLGTAVYAQSGDDDICDNYEESNPFLWGDEDPMEESQMDSSWPGKREDSFFDSLTR